VNGEKLYRERPTHLRMYATNIENGDVMIEIAMPVSSCARQGTRFPVEPGSLTTANDVL
jgi:hypothetical protein